MKEITYEELLSMFDEKSAREISDKATEIDSTHAVVFENAELRVDAPINRTALLVGPNNTCKSIAEVEGRYLGDLPSERVYPQYYAAIKGECYADKLKRKAEESCAARGHTIGPWKDCGTMAMADCQQCRAFVAIDTKPKPNGIDISGSAVGANCPYNPPWED